MGHDITAYRPVDVDAVREKYNLDGPSADSSDWGERYDQYREEVTIAYNRRSAGNPLNQVLYIALGVVDEAYAGCSGNGSTLDITLEQFRTGLEILRNKTFKGLKRERNMSDDIVAMFAAVGMNTFSPEMEAQDDDVSQEIKFCEDCIAYMEENKVATLPVTFG